MAVSVDGLVSGLDTTSIISQLIELECRPINLLEGKQTTLVSGKMAWSEVNSKLLSLETAANKLNTDSKFNALSSSFRNNDTSGGSVLSVTAGDDASAGSFSIVVSQLAEPEKWVSAEDTFTDATTALGESGTLVINGTNINIDTSDSLNDIRTAINGAVESVNATVLMQAQRQALNTSLPLLEMIPDRPMPSLWIQAD